MYGYNYMKKIVLRRADLKEYAIAERDFKYMYPSDFEDMYLLNLQGHLNHLSPEDKKILTTAVNLWTRNLVIRQRVEDFSTELRNKTYITESGELCGGVRLIEKALPVTAENRMRESRDPLKMNLPDHRSTPHWIQRIKQRWRWRHLVPVESIHHPMLTLNVSNFYSCEDGFLILWKNEPQGTQKKEEKQAVDLDALIALANAAVTVDSNIPPWPFLLCFVYIVNDDNLEYMRVFVKNQSTAIYSTGWSMKYVKSLTDEQLIAELEKIRMAVTDLKSQELRRTLKREKEMVKHADDKTFIKVVSDEDSEDEAPILWSALAGWEVISTPLGEINALYRTDQSTKHFTTLREILHMVDRQDLLKLYGMVVTYYENRLVTGAGLMLWGDLQVLIDSQEGGKGSSVWNNQSLWQIRSWRLYTLSNVHVLETVSGKVLYMFADVSYPLSVKLMERMLKHKLEIAKDVVGNDMTTAEQLIRFIKNQLAAAQVSPA
ncbi:hypothetical protein Tco_0939343 [Tanacetum coccineum]|uniref:Uncharacterized protein n=1 Tax=Tanacetum coccineum TaxID=301880 RepID=A0ABQ5DME5_9ASTR